MTSNNGSQTVDRALQVLDTLAGFTVPPRLSDLSEAVGLNISTTSRLLNSLEHFGYVRRDKQMGCYVLGYKLLHMAQIVEVQTSLHELADETLKQLVIDTNETATMTVIEQDMAMVVARKACSNLLRVAPDVGTRVPMYCTGAGKALLAFQSDEVVERILAQGMPPLTETTITTPNAMRAELENIRRRGYSLDCGEREVGLIAIHAGVRNITGNVVASVGVSGLDQRISPERIPEIAHLVLLAAGELSRRLGWQPVNLVESGVAASERFGR